MTHRRLYRSLDYDFEQVLVASSHFMWAFSQAALVVGCAAKVDVAKPAARLKATSVTTILFIVVQLVEFLRPGPLDLLSHRQLTAELAGPIGLRSLR